MSLTLEQQGSKMRRRLGLVLITLCPSLTSLTKAMISYSREQLLCDYLYVRVAVPRAFGGRGCNIYWLMANPKFLLLSWRQMVQIEDKIRNEANFSRGQKNKKKTTEKNHICYTVFPKSQASVCGFTSRKKKKGNRSLVLIIPMIKLLHNR